MGIKTILIADDDRELLQAMQIRLEAEGYRVIVTQDGYMALDRARRLRPDLLVLDVNMPAGSGFSVQERMATLPELVETPVLYVTAASASLVDAEARKLGAAGVLHKPFDTDELLESVRAALGYWVPAPAPTHAT